MIRPAVVHTYESSRRIPAPPDEVFALLADGVRLLELESEPEGAPMRRVVTAQDRGEGTYEVQMRLGPTEQAYEVTVEDVEVGRRLTHVRPGLRVEYEVESDTDGTRLRCSRHYDDDHGGAAGRLALKALDEESAVAAIDAHLAAIALALQPPAARELTETGGFAASTLVEQPPSAVFAFVSNPANVPSWVGGESEVEHLGGPLVGMGARHRLTRDPAARVPEASELTTIEYEPPRRVAFEVEGYAVDVYTVEPAPDGTRLTLERRPERRPRGFLARLGARARFTPQRTVPEIESQLEAIKGALGN